VNCNEASPGNAYTRTLQLAAGTLRGPAALALRLGVPLEELKRWMAGGEFPPHEVFLQALDIVARGPLHESPENRVNRAQAYAARLQAAANRVRESAALVQSSAQLARAQADLLRQAASLNGESSGRLGQIQPRDGAPASNKPGEAEKSGKS